MTAKKTDEKEEVPEGEGDKDIGTDSGGDGAGDDGLEARIRTLVHDAVESLLGDRGKSGGSHTRADDEEALFGLVKKAQEKIAADEAKEKRVIKLEETIEKIVEKPPARDGVAGKLQRFLWGSSD